MAYTPTVYVNDEPPAINADNLNKSEQGIATADANATSAKTEVEDVREGADGTVYSSAGDAVRGQIGDLSNELNDNLYGETVENKIEYTSIENSYVNSVGIISEAAGYTRTDYIKVDEFLSIKCSKDCYMAFWKADKSTFIGKYNINAMTKEVIPQDAVYVIVGNTTVLFSGSILYAETPSFGKEIKDKLDNCTEIAQESYDVLDIGLVIGKNRFNKSSTDNVDGKSIYYATGQEAVNEGVIASEYIPVNGDNVVVSGYTAGYVGGGVGMACYDANKAFVRGSNTSTMSITGAKFVRVSVKSTGLNTFQLEYGTVPTAYESYTSRTDSIRLSDLESKEQSTESKWKGKKALILGDSISTNAYLGYASWASRWANNTKAILINPSVHAVGFLCGAGSSTPDSNSLINLIDTLHQNYPNRDDFDLIVFFRGTNDFGNNIPMGQTGDTKTASFIGSVEYCFGKAIEYWSKARIVVFSPMQRRTEQAPNTAGKVLKDYSDAIKQAAQIMSYPVLDLYEDSGFLPVKNPFGSYTSGNNDFCNQYTMLVGGNPDGLHPNELFTETRLTPFIQAFLETV